MAVSGVVSQIFNVEKYRDLEIQVEGQSRSKCRDLENRVRGPSKSLNRPPFDRAHITSY